jgi:hypothetical protein
MKLLSVVGKVLAQLGDFFPSLIIGFTHDDLFKV